MQDNRLLIVLAFCDADKHLAHYLLERINDLGGCPENDLVLIHRPDVQLNAPMPFRSVAHVPPWCCLPNEKHPIGPNIMFQTALKYAQRHPSPFLWLEPDCVPLRRGWLKEIESEYAEALKFGKKLLSCVVRGKWKEFPESIPSGVSVYPTDAWKMFEGLNRNQGWDVQFADRLMPHVHESRCIQNRLNHVNPPHFVSGKKIAPNDMTLSDIPKSACLFHPCKDGSLMALLKSTTPKNKAFLIEQAMNETSKAMRRRASETARKEYDWNAIFTGIGVDVGAGSDPVQLPNCKPFDVHDGDANNLSQYIAKESLDYIHASQSLEHMRDPGLALLDWALCVKKGGHVVITVPDFDLYEKCNWPSRFNPDHKSAWSTWRKAALGIPLIHVPTFCRTMQSHGLSCVRVQLCDENYDYMLSPTIDQTLPSDGAEAFIEMVFRKDK